MSSTPDWLSLRPPKAGNVPPMGELTMFRPSKLGRAPVEMSGI